MESTIINLLMALLYMLAPSMGENDFRLNVWEYHVTVGEASVTCEKRPADVMPNIVYLDLYRAYGGSIFEDGSCNESINLLTGEITVNVP